MHKTYGLIGVSDVVFHVCREKTNGAALTRIALLATKKPPIRPKKHEYRRRSHASQGHVDDHGPEGRMVARGGVIAPGSVRLLGVWDPPDIHHVLAIHFPSFWGNFSCRFVRLNG